MGSAPAQRNQSFDLHVPRPPLQPWRCSGISFPKPDASGTSRAPSRGVGVKGLAPAIKYPSAHHFLPSRLRPPRAGHHPTLITPCSAPVWLLEE